MRSEHQRDKLTTKPAVAMFTAERAAVFLHQGGHILRQPAKRADIIGVLEVKQRAEMQFACGDVGIVGTVEPVFLQYACSFGNITGKEIRQHRSVFNHLHALSPTRYVEQHSQSCLAQFPYPGHLISSGVEREVVSEPRTGHIFFNGDGRSFNLLNCRPGDLNKQYGFRVSPDKEAVPVLLDIVLRAVEYIVIYQLHRCRIMLQRNDVCPDGILQAAEVGTEQAGEVICHRQQVEFHRGGECQSAFRTCKELADIDFLAVAGERIGLQQGIESIAVVAPSQGRMRVLPAYLTGIALIREHLIQIPVNLRLK